MRRALQIQLIGCLTVVSFASALAQEQTSLTYVAVRTTRPPAIDGDLSDAAWATAPEITGFTQRDPREGQPATQRTIVRVLYDDHAIYFGARMLDDGPVTSRLGRRDTSIESDSFRVFLDPHLDRRSGAHFGVYASNVQYDATLFNDTNSDVQWDAVWESATKVDANGWTAEIRIPLSQLRFPHRPIHTWGINFQRYVSRINELSRLVHVPKTESGFVSRFALLTGIAGIEPRRSLELLPYGVTSADRRETVSSLDPFRDRNEMNADLGLDVKYALTSNLTLTGTINPDFGQVEVDPAVVNLTQFETFFPEKRPFFVEGANLFQFGGGQSDHLFIFGDGYAEFFYSRRIGREPQAVGVRDFDFIDAPTESTILAAAKVTGKTANGWTIGAMDAITEKETAALLFDDIRDTVVVEPLTNYLVVRGAKDLGKRGGTGVLFTAVNRDVESGTEFLRREAYTGGLDGYFAFGDRDVILEWYLGGSLVRGSEAAMLLTQRSPAHYYHRPDATHLDLDAARTSLDGYTGRVMVAKQTGRWQYNIEARTFSPGFEPNDVGFMSRADITSTHAVVLYENNEPWRGTRYRSFWAGKYQEWNWDGDLLLNGVSSSWGTQFTNYWSASLSLGGSARVHDDRLTRGGPVIDRPANYRSSISLSTDSRKHIVLTLSGGGSFDEEGGNAHNASLGFTWRPANNLTFRVTPSYSFRNTFAQYVRTISDAVASHTYGSRYVFSELDQETFELATRLDWTFTSRLSLQLYLQPFVSAGDYFEFKEVARPRSLDYRIYDAISFDQATNRYLVDPDASGPAAPFGFGNPDFNFRSLRGNAVLRWEFRPGSAFYAVWTDNREEVIRTGHFALREDLSNAFTAPADDVFLLKVSYWLGL